MKLKSGSQPQTARARTRQHACVVCGQSILGMPTLRVNGLGGRVHVECVNAAREITAGERYEGRHRR